MEGQWKDRSCCRKLKDFWHENGWGKDMNMWACEGVGLGLHLAHGSGLVLQILLVKVREERETI